MNAPLRIAALLLALTANAGAWAQGASTIIGGLYTLHVEDRIATQGMVCSQRFPTSQADWTTDLTAARARHRAAFDELAAIAKNVAQRGPSPGNEGPKAIEAFREITKMLPHSELASLDDANASALCQRWRALLAPDAGFDKAMPEMLAVARRLQGPVVPR
ncbi:MAG: hypothetical protein LW768_17235 [Rubrivivax sp.]|jgi:hypothetical protein|nr:hypothetical protein [Rubrivivax sp.]